jgi:nitrogen fixation protein FixH
MKISIPTIIVITFTSFALMMGYFVVVAVRSDVNLVSQDYYQQELKHQDYMEAILRTEAVGDDIKIQLDRDKKVFYISVSTKLQAKEVKGIANFYRPSSSKLDFKQDFNTDANGQCAIAIDQLIKGNWKMSLTFEADGKKYLKETTFTY